MKRFIFITPCYRLLLLQIGVIMKMHYALCTLTISNSYVQR